MISSVIYTENLPNPVNLVESSAEQTQKDETRPSKTKHKKKRSLKFERLVVGGALLAAGAATAVAFWPRANTSDTGGIVRLDGIFEHVIGVAENAAAEIKFEKRGDGCFYIQNSKTQQTFCCGKIEHRTLAELRAADQLIVGSAHPGNASFKVICYTGQNPSRFSEADICALQAKPENAGAVFQLASRMHGLEGGCVHGGEKCIAGLGFNRMLCGPTQGEYASFSAAPGTIYKIYGYEPINLLANTPLAGFINPKHSGGGMPNIEQISEIADLADNWTDNLNIYFHEDIDVVAGKRIDKEHREVVINQRIHQIPVAAFDWRSSSKSTITNACKAGTLAQDARARLRAITGQMLNGFYEGTLLAAALKGNRKIFLTAVGGGAFQNDRDLIVAAIARPRNLEIIRKYGLEVTLVVHDGGQKAIDWQESMDLLRANKDIEYNFEIL